jgi:hypothetical protein
MESKKPRHVSLCPFFSKTCFTTTYGSLLLFQQRSHATKTLMRTFPWSSLQYPNKLILRGFSRLAGFEKTREGRDHGVGAACLSSRQFEEAEVYKPPAQCVSLLPHPQLFVLISKRSRSPGYGRTRNRMSDESMSSFSPLCAKSQYLHPWPLETIVCYDPGGSGRLSRVSIGTAWCSSPPQTYINTLQFVFLPSIPDNHFFPLKVKTREHTPHGAPKDSTRSNDDSTCPCSRRGTTLKSVIRVCNVRRFSAFRILEIRTLMTKEHDLLALREGSKGISPLAM